MEIIKTLTVTPVRQGAGGSAYYMDLSSEMDAVALDTEEKTTERNVISTTVSIYHGTQKVIFSESPVASGYDESIEVYNDYTEGKSEVTFTVIIPEGIPFTSQQIIITAKAEEIELSNTFNIKAFRAGADGKDAVIYFLQPTVDSIKIDSNGNYSVSEIGCSQFIRVGNNASETSSMQLKYKIDGGDINDYQSPIVLTNQKKSIQFLLYNGIELLDSETVLIITDGKDGSNGLSLVNKGNWEPGQYDENDYVYYEPDRVSYVCRETHASETFDYSKWIVLSAHGDDATQYYIHYVYCDNFETGENYSTTETRKYIGVYTDTVEADIEDYSQLPKDITWSQIEGDIGPAANDYSLRVSSDSIHKNKDGVLEPDNIQVEKIVTITQDNRTSTHRTNYGFVTATYNGDEETEHFIDRFMEVPDGAQFDPNETYYIKREPFELSIDGSDETLAHTTDPDGDDVSGIFY